MSSNQLFEDMTNTKFSPEDMEALTSGLSKNNNDPWLPLFLLFVLQTFSGSKLNDKDIDSRISNLEGRVEVIEKLVTKTQ